MLKFAIKKEEYMANIQIPKKFEIIQIISISKDLIKVEMTDNDLEVGELIQMSIPRRDGDTIIVFEVKKVMNGGRYLVLQKRDIYTLEVN